MSGLKGLKKQRRIQVVVISFACVLAILGILWALPSDAFQYFRSPSEIVQNPPSKQELFRVGGLVKDRSIEQEEDGTLTFVVTDGAEDIRVVFLGITPDLFAENQGVVAQGYYVDGQFKAIEILAKHDENYMPKEVIDTLKEQGVYVDPNGEFKAH